MPDEDITKRFARRVASVAMPLTVLYAAMMLSGCAVGPDYRVPTSAMPDSYNGQAKLDAHNGSRVAPALDTWWDGFNDPVLTHIINKVLAQNLDIEASFARVAQARASARDAYAQRLPSGNLSADATRQRQSLEGPIGRIASSFPDYERDQSVYDVGAGASWELDVAGGLKRGVEAANAEVQAAEADQLGVRISVAAEAADAYFRVRGAQRRIALAEDQVKTNLKLLELVRLRQLDGFASDRERYQAEAFVSQASATIPPLRTERDVQMNRLDVLMAVQPGTCQAELSVTNDPFDVPAISTSEGPVALLRRRPDVIAAERRLAASNARIGVATAAYYPSLSLSALLGFVSLGSTNFISAAAFQPQVAAGLRWRLFDFGRVDAEVALATGAQAEALAVYRKAMLRATGDVENALVTLTELESQNAALLQQVAAEKKARNMTQDSYEAGAVSLYEVLQEDRQLLVARDEQALVRSNMARAAVSTFRALGGGW